MKKVIALLMVLIMCFGSVSYADGILDVFSGESVEARQVDNGFTQRFLGYFTWFGYAIAIGMLIYIGIKYTMAAAEERANTKKVLVRYVIGAILISGASAILSILINVG